MDDRSRLVRRRMEHTKRQLADKLESLERQVTAQVHSAGTAVNATVEAVHDVVHSVSNAFDIERQFEKHPWMILGGSAVLGYLVTEYLAQDTAKLVSAPSDEPFAEHNGNGNGVPVTAALSTAKMDARIQQSVSANLLGNEVRRAAISAFTGLAQQLVLRAVPQVMNYFRHHEVIAKEPGQESGAERQK